MVTRVRPARAGAASPRRPARRACSGPASSSRCGRAPHAAPRRPAPRPAAAFGNAFVRCRAPARSPEQPGVTIHNYVLILQAECSVCTPALTNKCVLSPRGCCACAVRTPASCSAGGCRERACWSQVSSAQLEVFWAAMSHVQGCTTTPQARSPPKPIEKPAQRCCTPVTRACATTLPVSHYPHTYFIHPYIMSRMRTQNCRGCRDVAQKDTQQWLSTTQVHFARCLHTKSTHCEVVTRFRAGKVLHLGRLPVGLAHPAGPERAHDAHVLPDQHGLIDVKALKPQALAPPVPGTPRLCCASPGCRCHVQGLAAAAHMCILSMEASGGRRMC